MKLKLIIILLLSLCLGVYVLFHKGYEEHQIEYTKTWKSSCGYTNVSSVVLEPMLNFTSVNGYTLKDTIFITNNTSVMKFWSTMHVGGTPSEYTSGSHWSADSWLKVTYNFKNHEKIAFRIEINSEYNVANYSKILDEYVGTYDSL